MSCGPPWISDSAAVLFSIRSAANVLDQAHAHAREIHFHRRFFHGCLPSRSRLIMAVSKGRRHSFGTCRVTAPAFVSRLRASWPARVLVRPGDRSSRWVPQCPSRHVFADGLRVAAGRHRLRGNLPGVRWLAAAGPPTGEERCHNVATTGVDSGGLQGTGGDDRMAGT